MKWIKKGLIYGPNGESSWAKDSALTPTPFLMDNEQIRVYAGFRDGVGVSRIGFVDLDAKDPSIILKISKDPVLDIGAPGTFDDNGVILGDIVPYENKLYMYYVGFQLVQKAKFLAFSGLAISHDGGNTFERYSKAPILDRIDQEIHIRAIHSVLVEESKWKIWYAAGNSWQWINNTQYPQYHIKYIESYDGVNFNDHAQLCIDTCGDEYRIGRPRVTVQDNLYKMFYTKGTLSGDYIAGYAESLDGLNWKRMDDKIGISLSKSGWDSKALCYPSLLNYQNNVYMFYNGNDMGKAGFGLAILDKSV